MDIEDQRGEEDIEEVQDHQYERDGALDGADDGEEGYEYEMDNETQSRMER